MVDSGWFEIEPDKTVLVGPNEAGKTAILEALLRINPPVGVAGYDPPVDVPRTLAADVVDADLATVPVATARFVLDDAERALLPDGFDDATYVVERRLANNVAHWLEGGPHDHGYPPEVRTALSELAKRVPMFVYFDSRFTAGLAIDVADFADRYDRGLVAPTQQDLGNLALFRLLDQSPRELADVSAGASSGDPVEVTHHRQRLADVDERLAAAGDLLTRELRRMWRPSGERVEATTIEVVVEGGVLRLVASDDAGVRVPLTERSSGFRWLVSFLVVFLAESTRSLDNAVIMLDEPGTSLHVAKQAEFRATLSRLARLHQLIFTTHSPHMLYPGDLERVRSVERVSSEVGTTVHTGGGAVDHAVTAPLLEAVGLRLADELFDEGNSILFSSLTDYWYTSAAFDLLGPSEVLASATLLPVGPVSQLATLSAFLRTQGVHVVAVVDSESAGVGPDAIARRVNGVNIVRPAAAVGRRGSVTVEDLFAHTLVAEVAPSLGWNAPIDPSTTEPVLSLLARAAGADFDRRALARAFIDWTAIADVDDIDPRDRAVWSTLFVDLEAALS